MSVEITTKETFTFRWRHVGDDACDQFAVEEGDIIAYRIVKVPQ